MSAGHPRERKFYSPSAQDISGFKVLRWFRIRFTLGDVLASCFFPSSLHA